MKKTPQTLVFLILLSCSVNAQSSSHSPVEKINGWRVVDVPGDISLGFGFDNAFSFQKAIIYTGDNEAIASVFDDNKGYTLKKINADMEVKWETVLKGFVIGLAKWKGNILAFYTKDWNGKIESNKILQKIFAVVVNPETGKIILEKPVFENTTGYYQDPKFLNKPDGEFCELLLREANYSTSKKERNLNQTNKINALFFDQELNTVASMPINSLAIQGVFTGTTVNSLGETFIASASANQFIVERFDNSMSLIDKQAINLNWAEGKFLEPAFCLNQQNEKSVLFALVFKDHNLELTLCNFDFTTKKTVTATEALDKEFERRLNDEASAQRLSKAKFKELKAMKPVAIVQSGERIAVIMEEKYSEDYMGPGPTWSRLRNDDMVVTIFDGQLRILAHSLIAKEGEVHYTNHEQTSVGYQVKDNKLVIASNTGTDVRKRNYFLATIDMTNFKTEISSPTKGPIIEPGATLWFKKGYLISNGVVSKNMWQILY